MRMRMHQSYLAWLFCNACLVALIALVTPMSSELQRGTAQNSRFHVSQKHIIELNQLLGLYENQICSCDLISKLNPLYKSNWEDKSQSHTLKLKINVNSLDNLRMCRFFKKIEKVNWAISVPTSKSN